MMCLAPREDELVFDLQMRPEIPLDALPRVRTSFIVVRIGDEVATRVNCRICSSSFRCSRAKHETRLLIIGTSRSGSATKQSVFFPFAASSNSDA